MRIITVLILGLISAVDVHAQIKTAKKFHFPSGSSASAYIPGKVLVKVKSKYRETFQQGRTAVRSAQGLHQVRPISTGKGQTHTARAQAFKPVIDISLYFEISFDPSIPVEDFIAGLYADGQVEIAEPVYRQRMTVTPNDPSIGSQYYLSKVKAMEAWDITQGDEDMIIAIIDSGVDIDHPDLVSQMYINDDPVNGIDDDDNGYIDDYRGWDFSGADTLNAFDPDFVGDNDPAIYKNGPGFGHGTQVGACASASTNDGVGVAGVGYKTRLMFIKHYADNQPASDRNYSSNLYLGVQYAADNGAKVINCSWGSTYRSQIYQDIITHVTLDQGCLVVAAAGNENVSTPLYPASYDYVLSAASTDQNDKRSSFSNYGSTVDITAPGTAIFTAQYDNGYGSTSGTSFSSPITAGAAALVWSVHPEYTPLQVAEQLRVTADESMYTQNASFINKLGKGRLDIFRALTESSPSIRASNYELKNASGQAAEPGDEAFLYLDFKNYLQGSSSALEITISTSGTGITITKDRIAPGAIASGATIRNTSEPFELTIGSTVAENKSFDLLITFSDGDYQDFQVLSFVPNPSYRDIDDNKVITTISSSGKLAYEDTNSSSGGSGFVYNDASILFEMGLIMGSSSATILNTVRNGSGGYDADFVSLDRIKEIIPGERSSAEIFGSFSNSQTVANQSVVVSYRSLVWREAPYDQFIILEYKIKNPKAVAINDFYFGIFADWDISFAGAKDAALWDADTKLGYVFPKQSTSLPQAGVQLLSGLANYYAIDNDHSIGGNPLGIYDGFTDTEKFTSLSSGFFKVQAGNSSAAGNDVSHVVSSGPYNINPDEEITVAFALHAANNIDDLINSAKYADSIYNYTLNAPRPLVDTLDACYGAQAVLTATGATSFNWYRDFTGGTPIETGNQFTIDELLNDTTVFVSNADESFESVRTAAHISAKARPVIEALGSTVFCDGESVTLSVDEGNEYVWSTEETTQSIEVTEAGDYHVTVTYTENSLNCESVSETITVDVLENSVSQFSMIVIPESNTVEFVDESSDATEWLWDFGDGVTSDDQNPTHTYLDNGEFEIQQTVTHANGCTATSSDMISIVLSVEDALARSVSVFPIPAHHNDLTITIEGLRIDHLRLTLLGPHGNEVQQRNYENISGRFTDVMNVRSLNAGIYFLKIQADNRVAFRKIAITR